MKLVAYYTKSVLLTVPSKTVRFINLFSTRVPAELICWCPLKELVMKKLVSLYVLIMMCGWLNAQLLPVPSEGTISEVAVERTVLSINPMTVQPSVFFSPLGIDKRENRKWWRTDSRSPLNYAAIEASLLPFGSPLRADIHQWVSPKTNSLLTDPFLIRLWQLQKSLDCPDLNC